MIPSASIFVAGHRGLVGSAITHRLRSAGFANLLLRERHELDLTQQVRVDQFFAAERPQYVFLAAAKVGGILANRDRPAEFIYNNLAIQTNVIDAAFRNGCTKLLFLGSSCIYPKYAPQPMTEDCLLTGALEPTNEWYAVAKIAGLKMVQAYRQQYGFNAISLMPTNLYGPGDNFSLKTSGVLPGLLRKLHEAKMRAAPEVCVWGTGKPRRELLHVDDLADTCLYLMSHYDDSGIVNVGWGTDITIAELAELIARIVGFEGRLTFDSSMPDGTPRKLLDTRKLKSLGWTPQISLEAGIRSTYRWYLENIDAVKV